MVLSFLIESLQIIDRRSLQTFFNPFCLLVIFYIVHVALRANRKGRRMCYEISRNSRSEVFFKNSVLKARLLKDFFSKVTRTLLKEGFYLRCSSENSANFFIIPSLHKTC